MLHDTLSNFADISPDAGLVVREALQLLWEPDTHQH